MFNQIACWVTPHSTKHQVYTGILTKTKTESNRRRFTIMQKLCDFRLRLDSYCKGQNFKDIPWGACAVGCSNPALIFLWSFGRRKADFLVIRNQNPHKPLGFTFIRYWMNMIKAKSNQNVIWFLGKLHFYFIKLKFLYSM